MTPNVGVILDRDGTLVDVVREEESGVITTAFHPSQLRLLPGVAVGLRRLAEAGFVLAVATNQPGAAKGHFSVAAIERTNQGLIDLLASEGIHLAAIETCFHHPSGGTKGRPALVTPCNCRKPAPGLLVRLIERFSLDPGSSWMVGDTPSDIDAGVRAGMLTAFLRPTDRCLLCPARSQAASVLRPPNAQAGSFDALVEKILSYA